MFWESSIRYIPDAVDTQVNSDCFSRNVVRNFRQSKVFPVVDGSVRVPGALCRGEVRPQGDTEKQRTCSKSLRTRHVVVKIQVCPNFSLQVDKDDADHKRDTLAVSVGPLRLKRRLGWLSCTWWRITTNVFDVQPRTPSTPSPVVTWVMLKVLHRMVHFMLLSNYM